MGEELKGLRLKWQRTSQSSALDSSAAVSEFDDDVRVIEHVQNDPSSSIDLSGTSNLFGEPWALDVNLNAQPGPDLSGCDRESEYDPSIADSQPGLLCLFMMWVVVVHSTTTVLACQTSSSVGQDSQGSRCLGRHL